jgi:hypothetical protein
MIPFVVDVPAISNVIFFALSSISSILYGFFFQYRKNSAFPIVKTVVGGGGWVVGKKNLNVSVCV